jgi:predicted MFS family arabinose efflux permease
MAVAMNNPQPAIPVDRPAGPEVSPTGDEREATTRIMSAGAFLIFFQAYLVAPLIPSLASQFHVSEGAIGLLVPAYMLPYGASTLFYGPISDRIGRRPILLAMLGLMAVTAAGAATAASIGQLLVWRVLAGVASGGIIPISLALVGDLYPYRERGRPLGWVFGAIAGGMAFGSTLGALLNPIVGWRMFLAVAVACGVVCIRAVRHLPRLPGASAGQPRGLRLAFASYATLLADRRGRRGYAYILFNGMFHSGVFTWLGPYFAARYGLGDTGIGLALVGYGIPGMVLGPAIGRFADRVGRRAIIPAGLLISGLAAIALMPYATLAWAVAVATVLSLGYDMSHPLLAGIITSLDPSRRGQAMGLNAFALFTGFGLGSLLFQALLSRGFAFALGAFAAAELLLAIFALPAFRSESPHTIAPHIER